MARQAELDELRKEIEDLKKNNPVTDMVNAVSEVQSTISNPVGAMLDGPGISAEPMAPVEGAIEPRSGEFEVTDSAASAAAPVPPAGPAAP
ncbi:MAG: hypothetical protein JF627_06250 [Alphaproteobacteria bacterium]|nr:hypothetical protein [Alphaproteobacteria bacterium]